MKRKRCKDISPRSNLKSSKSSDLILSETKPLTCSDPTGYKIKISTSFKRLLRNEYCFKRYVNKRLAQDLGRCSCTKSCDQYCTNKSIYIECNKDTCQICKQGSKDCGNCRFTLRQYKLVTLFDTKSKGIGLRTAEDIKLGEFVIEYVGEIINLKQLEERKKMTSKLTKHIYVFSLGNETYIDATYKGNLARFINHSCEPNLVAQKWFVGSDIKVGLFSLKDIKAGDELTFDYRFGTSISGDQPFECMCGSKLCEKRISNTKDSRIYNEITNQYKMTISNFLNVKSLSKPMQRFKHLVYILDLEYPMVTKYKDLNFNNKSNKSYCKSLNLSENLYKKYQSHNLNNLKIKLNYQNYDIKLYLNNILESSCIIMDIFYISLSWVIWSSFNQFNISHYNFKPIYESFPWALFPWNTNKYIIQEIENYSLFIYNRSQLTRNLSARELQIRLRQILNNKQSNILDIIETWSNDEVCQDCGSAGNLISCDNCWSSYHISCAKLIMSPSSLKQWVCILCRKYKTR
ncbi:SET domain-containing protein [Cryptosporidium muris RN66]|uniref:SET domain-containing protein n=1 Tax=Cryptosporidium muris (strain RN66) TaxID=441375 RepID=B6AG96_CRYMR|nr:SET domain-containing protein [Cryptosporidium muris RN66]EEA07237.1 SET domain-containing protein [Cryptosporidium muris RN66]|eukprot:XP_002141586.1 SET domain-containing protein [Cryptosporidium muris RN66]